MSGPSLLAVVNHFPHPSETFVLRKLTGLRDAGVDVQVAARAFTPEAAEVGMGLVLTAPWSKPRASWSILGLDGLARVTSATARQVVATRTRRSTLTARQAALLAPLRQAEADIVHFEFSGIAVECEPFFDQLRPARLVVSCRGAAEQIRPLRDPSRARALRAVFEQVDLIHCVSDDMRRTVEQMGAPSEKILVNRPAVPVADLAPLAARRSPHDGPLRVLSIGRLHWKKGLDDGLRAIARVVADGSAVEHRIAGEGAERDKLTFLAHQLGIGGSVSLLGVQRQHEVRELLAWADVLLLPSLSEGISNAVLEAMAAGLPVVATTCGGMDEAITSGVDGILVPVGDVDAMAEGLRSLADDRSMASRLGTAAAATAARHFDLSRQIAVFADAYRSLGRPARRHGSRP